MNILRLACALFAALPLAAAPLVTVSFDKVEIVLPAGHSAAWVTYGAREQIWATGLTDSDKDGRITVDPVYFGPTWIVVDVDTGEWTAAPRVTQSPLPAGTILKGGGKWSLLAIEAKFAGSALWVRPGEAAWGPASLLAFPTGVYDYVEPTSPLFRWMGIGTRSAPPSGFQRGDLLFLLSGNDAATGSVNAQLDVPDNPGAISFGQNGREFTEGNIMYFDLVRIGGTSGTVRVRCCNYAGTAVPGLDFTPPPVQEYVFEPGQYHEHISFPLLQDDAHTQTRREVRITPVSITGGSFGGVLESVLYIHDNDPAPQLALGPLAGSYPETDTPWMLQVPVTLTGKVRGPYTGSLEVSRSRMPGWTKVPFVFREGETAKNVEVPIAADDVATGSYSIQVRLGTTTRTVTIVEDDAPQMKIEGATVRENEREARVAIILEPKAPSAVTYTVRVIEGTAKAGQDFRYAGPREFSTQGSNGISISVLDDRIEEGPETFYVELESITGPVIPPQVTRVAVTIEDDDTGFPGVTVVETSVFEGNSGQRKVPVRVMLSRPMPSTITLQAATQSDSARQSSDYFGVYNILTYPPGVTEAVYDVTVYGDTEQEDDERAFVMIQADGAFAARGSLWILDDDRSQRVVSPSNATAFEKTGGSSTAAFRVWFSPATKVAGSFRYQTADGTATAGSDYAAKSGTVPFPAGTTYVDVEVEVYGDAVSEQTEDFFLKIDAQPEWLTLASDTARATIYDDDSPNAPHRFRISDASVQEGNDWREASFTVSLSRAAATPLKVSWATEDGTAVAPLDYQSAGGTLTFAPGQTAQTVKVRVAGDTDDERLETFAVVLKNGDALLEDDRGICTIEDDEQGQPKRRTSRH